jgi:selenide,water dikinase
VCVPGAERATVLTMDVITPIVDDPRAFGRIAAANSLSDVYAMGGRPEVALSFVGFPHEKLGLDALREVLAGMAEVCVLARCAIIGGHTIGDSEPKAGLSVTGSVDRDRVWSHRHARKGQALILTKAIGTGIVGQAIRAGVADEALVAKATAQMSALNDVACAVGQEHGVTACTDVTGFGLLGHLKHIVEASHLTAHLDASHVPLLEGVIALVERGLVPGGSKRNLAYASTVTTFADAVSAPMRLLLADAQTSGGLLLCVPEESSERALRALHDRGVADAAVIGHLDDDRDGQIDVR